MKPDQLRKKGRYAKEWTAREEEILRTMWKDHTGRELEKLLPGKTESQIRSKAFNMDLKKDFIARSQRLLLEGKKKKRATPKPRKAKSDTSRGVIAFELERVLMFDTVCQAAKHYEVSEDRISGLIKRAESLNGIVTFNYIKD